MNYSWEQSDVTVFIFREMSKWLSVVLGPKATDEKSVHVHVCALQTLYIYTTEVNLYYIHIQKSQCSVEPLNYTTPLFADKKSVRPGKKQMTSESSPLWSVRSPKIMLACSKLRLIPSHIIENSRKYSTAYEN